MYTVYLFDSFIGMALMLVAQEKKGREKKRLLNLATKKFDIALMAGNAPIPD